MAGTIISTPSLGASDWSTWITQQERTDRGYMRISLTNFSGTAASSIATGGVMECAGSIYQFTETAMSLATGTASASVAVYFQVIPAAGGTTCTVVMDSTAPVWSDAKQGFYASAASTTRVIGGCYIGTAATYYNKYLYTGTYLDYCLRTGETRPLIEKTFEMGEWNMDANAATTVSHSLIFGDILKIRKASAMVRSDVGTMFNLNGWDAFGTAGTVSGGISSISKTVISVSRKVGSQFDHTNFDGTASTVANRGWVYIEYEA